ncbi:DHBP synthase RibB-like alpha/beta domain-containing protein [Xylaria bambusicola]|uniref:DHBP synthase RibB-like alpha/beta domain-containing protein n=1 Tax=Xylaria bambusicola TaxID=326684 RepID=UPI002007A54A|nr:DHBP synthase RibB-like alpha/beta domain-containing protein [Xylaria bambusicola]KAI0523720.1 DHBP synthase RibB-like alpha/beta domain-containing protein [Xylaria bambusicola]
MSRDLPRQAPKLRTQILKVVSSDLGEFKENVGREKMREWEVSQMPSAKPLREAADYLKARDIPVAFPTETVYGLGADATRSAAVKGIYSAKGRPSDNPLIIHVADLDMLRHFLQPATEQNGTPNGIHDQIPEIYKPLIERFWPGPLTILMPNPTPSKLAPEVTAGQKTFGVRMPASPLARSLIKLVGAPLAAPSANASTKPSPTTAAHVLEDLDGRIELILDGGPCQVGVESTVVDGICDPPVVLRPGGVSIEELRECPGWESVEKAYKDHSEAGKAAPRAPGMKYKHYSPKARVVLYEATYPRLHEGIDQQTLELKNSGNVVGVIRTRCWQIGGGLFCRNFKEHERLVESSEPKNQVDIDLEVGDADLYKTRDGPTVGKVLDISIGKDTRSIAQGLFAALRELDRRGADVIFVEGTPDGEDIGAAVMNRLRKAASQIKM